MFHEKLGTQAERIERIVALARPACAARRRRCREGRARGATVQGRPAHRSRRRIPRTARPDGPILRGGAGRGRSRRARHARITTSRRARTISCRPIRCRSRSRSPTRSTRWSASGRSTRSRRAARTRMRCAGRRWALSGSSSRISFVLRSAGLQYSTLSSLRRASSARRLCTARLSSSIAVRGLAQAIDERAHKIATVRAAVTAHEYSMTDYRPPLLLRRPPEGPTPRARRAARSGRRRVRARQGQDDLLLIVRRVEALGKFLDTDDGKNLLAGVKRATNIIRIEEKKDERAYTGAPDACALRAGRGEGARRRHRRREGGGAPRRRARKTSPPP